MNELNQEERKTLNNLAREQLILKILADVDFDMRVCQLEGWDIMELPLRIKSEMEKIIR